LLVKPKHVRHNTATTVGAAVSLSGLTDESREPEEQQIDALLGDAATQWRALIDAISEAHPPVIESWSFGGIKYGWSLRLNRKARVILYLIPQDGGFLAGIVLGERAFQEARSLQLPDHVRRLLEGAPLYGEGHGFRIPVADSEDVRAVTQLVKMKMVTR
jgi:hypothetical protein